MIFRRVRKQPSVDGEIFFNGRALSQLHKCVTWASSLIVIYLGGPIAIMLKLKLLEVWEFWAD